MEELWTAGKSSLLDLGTKKANGLTPGGPELGLFEAGGEEPKE